MPRQRKFETSSFTRGYGVMVDGFFDEVGVSVDSVCHVIACGVVDDGRAGSSGFLTKSVGVVVAWGVANSIISIGRRVRTLCRKYATMKTFEGSSHADTHVAMTGPGIRRYREPTCDTRDPKANDQHCAATNRQFTLTGVHTRLDPTPRNAYSVQ